MTFNEVFHMQYRALTVATVALLGLAVVTMPSGGFAQQADQASAVATATEDVVYMRDGRELHGQIVSETKSLIIFEYMDPTLKVKTKLTLLKDNVIQIDRDVEIKVDAVPEQKAATAAPTSKTKAAEPERNYGITRAQGSIESAPSVYLVPMKGQMGTDINSEVYKRVIEDIKQLKPEIVVIELDSQDTEDVLFSAKGREEEGLLDFDEYRLLVQLFRNELPGFRQVCWVHDSMGISSMVALAWGEMYMKPTARFGGLIVTRQIGFDQWQDEDVRGKMTAAFMAFVKSFLESGGYALVLADAMVQPKFSLSATWKGRDVEWSLNDKGEYLVDGSDKRTTEFRAKAAEDFCISKGTAETLDDLALLLGYREFRVIDGQGEELCADYIQDWRRAYEDAKKLFLDVQQYMSWASGEDTVKYLGRAKTALERILSYIERYKAVEIRLAREFGVGKEDLTVQIEQIKERLRALKNNSARNGTGGGGTRRGGSGAAE
jgi:hypothetical protein